MGVLIGSLGGEQKQERFSIQKPAYYLNISISGEAYESHTLYFSQISLLTFVYRAG